MATNKFIPPKGKTWRRAFKDSGKKIPIEINGKEVEIIIAGLIHFGEYLKKQSRFEKSRVGKVLLEDDLKDVEKLLEDFRSFDSFIVGIS